MVLMATEIWHVALAIHCTMVAYHEPSAVKMISCSAKMFIWLNKT